jgi:hypothetical protein
MIQIQGVDEVKFNGNGGLLHSGRAWANETGQNLEMKLKQGANASTFGGRDKHDFVFCEITEDLINPDKIQRDEKGRFRSRKRLGIPCNLQNRSHFDATDHMLPAAANERIVGQALVFISLPLVVMRFWKGVFCPYHILTAFWCYFFSLSLTGVTTSRQSLQSGDGDSARVFHLKHFPDSRWLRP